MLALVLTFWCVHEPRRMGIGVAWVLGLLMDAGNGALLGQHAFAYAVLAFAALSLHRRILWFPVLSQSLYVLPLLLVAQLASAAVRLWVGGASANWWVGLTESAVGALMWPLVNWILFAPQRRPISRDETRPI